MKSGQEACGTFRRQPLFRDWTPGRRWGTKWGILGDWVFGLGFEGSPGRESLFQLAETSKCKAPVVEGVWGVFGEGRTRMHGRMKS